MIRKTSRHLLVWVVATAFAALTPASSWAAATITILNNDGAGEGFNDPTPFPPEGGNPGTTLGQLRLNAFAAAAAVWGSTVNSTVTIVIRAQFNPQTCTATSAVLGSAGAVTAHANFTGAPLGNTWYGQALANSRAAIDLDASNPDINATFNSNLNGSAACLGGRRFYFGLDNNHGANIDLFTVLLHELGHGLGFQTFTNGTSGAFLSSPSFPSVYDHFAYDNTQGTTWALMASNGNRAASALNFRNLAWIGANAVAQTINVLSPGSPELQASAPASVAGSYVVATAAFGAVLNVSGVTGEVMPIAEQTPGAGQGCETFNAANSLAANGKIALIDRGVCGFVVKVKNAQNAGAIAVIIGNNAAGSPTAMGGEDATITIPSVMISNTDAAIFRNALRFRSRTRSGVFASLIADPSQLAGADQLGRPLLFTPNPFQGGSSVSHWDTVAFRNLLMEPAINADLTHSVVPPEDLTFMQLKDIGWNP